MSDFMEVGKNLATTVTQILNEITASTNNSIQIEPESKDKESKFQPIPPILR
jgi:hypothetical protein